MLKSKTAALDELLARVRSCQACEDLPCGPRPVLQADARARLLIVGQAPGRLVHATGIPWNDRSGERLRAWLGVDRGLFYGPLVALLPMGFCYPGSGPRGDLPPRPGCAPLWFPRLRQALPEIRLTLLVGRYAQSYHLGKGTRETLTETVRQWADYGAFWPLPHPSGRNNHWLRRNPWFEAEVIPGLKDRVRRIVGAP